MIKPLVLASYNWKVLLKSIVYQLLLLALIVALGYLIFGNLIDDIVNVFNDNNISNLLSETINSIAAGDFESEQFASELSGLISNIQKAIAAVKLPFGGVTMSYVMFCAIYLLYRLFVSLTDVAVACQLEEFMTSNAERPFSWFVIKKQGVTWKFALLQMAFAFPMDLLIVLSCLGFFLLFLVAFRWWAIIPAAIIAVLFYVARLSLFAYILPSVVCKNCSVHIAFRQGLARAPIRFWQVFWKTLVVVAIMIGVSVLVIMFVPNPIVKTLLISVPNFVLFFYLKCVNMIEYFHFDNRPFFYKRVEIEGTDRYNRRQERMAKKASKVK